ncbi:MAG TPA: LysR family transcriptional regulator [Polyangiaceae bacterium]|nr:LysR family transcriptional regulator [Polyangiaceae bacterium]
MELEWDDVRLFLAIAEHGSLTEAARRLKVGQPTVSRRLGELEQRLGYALFQRGVAGAELTSLGERWLDPARHMAEWAGELLRTAERADSTPSGVVRISAPPGVAYDFVAPFARALRERYPQLALEVSSRVEYVDLARREADLALRTREPTQRDLTCVATLTHRNDAFVAPSYRQRLPQRPRLDQIAWIAWAPPFDQLSPNPELSALLPDFRPAFAADDFIVQRRAAEEGVGAIFLGCVRHRYSRPSELVPLGLELGAHARSALHLVCAKSALGVPRVRAVAELLAEELAWAQRTSDS